MGPMIATPRLLGALILTALSTTAMAQTAKLSNEDYAQAERFAMYNATPLVDHAVTTVNWVDGTHFWYRDHDAGGDHYLRVDASTGKAEPAFDQTKLAAALGKASGKPVDANKLMLTDFTRLDDGRLDVKKGGKHYLCDLTSADSCTVKQEKEPGVLSPDKRSEAFIRDWNLWVRDVGTGKETQLTTDGVEDFGYATDKDRKSVV